MSDREKMMAAANRLAKWRSVFAGWQLGTRPSTDPECQAVRNTAERTLLLRAEVSGLTRLLVDEGLVSADRVMEVFTEEYDALSKDLEGQFPGAQATDAGMSFDIQEFAKTAKGWKP